MLSLNSRQNIFWPSLSTKMANFEGCFYLFILGVSIPRFFCGHILRTSTMPTSFIQVAADVFEIRTTEFPKIRPSNTRTLAKIFAFFGSIFDFFEICTFSDAEFHAEFNGDIHFTVGFLWRQLTSHFHFLVWKFRTS